MASFAALQHARSLAMRHLRLAYPESSDAWCRRTALRCFVHLVWNAVDFFHFTMRRPAELRSAVRVTGLGNLEAAARRGKGVMCISAHVGNWELLGCWVVQAGYPLTALARKLYYPKLNRWVNTLRETIGLKVLDRNSPAGRIFAQLRRGGLIGALIDQDTRTRGVFVPFFGRPAYTPIGPAILASRAGSALVPIFMTRLPDHSYHVSIGKSRIPGSGSDGSAAHELTAWATRMIEDAIRTNPEQWVWMHRRWRTTPPRRPGSRP